MLGNQTLKRYTVHQKEGVEDSTILIREGFSIWAFIFGFLWLFAHRAWAPALLTLALALMLRWLESAEVATPVMLGVLQLGVQYWIGIEARDWQRDALEARGYRMSDIVMETSEERAELRFYERHVMIAGDIHQSTPTTA